MRRISSSLLESSEGRRARRCVELLMEGEGGGEDGGKRGRGGRTLRGGLRRRGGEGSKSEIGEWGGVAVELAWSRGGEVGCCWGSLVELGMWVMCSRSSSVSEMLESDAKSTSPIAPPPESSPESESNSAPSRVREKAWSDRRSGVGAGVGDWARTAARRRRAQKLLSIATWCRRREVTVRTGRSHWRREQASGAGMNPERKVSAEPTGAVGNGRSRPLGEMVRMACRYEDKGPEMAGDHR